jgi:5'-methylthioadenosine phosphorylase
MCPHHICVLQWHLGCGVISDMALSESAAEIAVIGGSGFYEMFDRPEEVRLDTPWGPPSGPVTVGEVGGRAVAFLARHGRGHELAPDRVNYRANLWALRQLGVTRVIAACAVGSLRADLRPGDFVVLDQLVDLTRGRPDSYLDSEPARFGLEQTAVEHVGFAEPYCPELRGVLDRDGVHPGGTVVVIPGPRFATRAESTWYRSQGWDVVNMTQYPEAYLARELGMCYAGLALVTDHDTGREGDPDVKPVTMDAVLAVLTANVTRARDLLLAAVPDVPSRATCPCQTSGARQLRSVCGPRSPADDSHRS